MSVNSRIISAIGWLRRFFGSVKLAVILILLLIAFSLIGALIIQIPHEYTTSSTMHVQWIDSVAKPKFGVWATPLNFLGLFDVFHSPWFLLAGGLLVVNILVCTLNRLKLLRTNISGGLIKLADEFYQNGTERADFSQTTTTQNLAESSSQLLKKKHYRVRIEQSEDKIYIAADRNRFFRTGTLLSHLSLIVLVLGYVVGNYTGFSNTSFVVPEGTVREVGYNTGLSLSLESFVDEYSDDGTPKDYRSQVTIYKNGNSVKQGVIRVNYPMSYEGVRFFQSFFGPASQIQIQNADGKTIYNDIVPLAQVTTVNDAERPLGSFDLPEENLSFYIVGTAFNGNDPYIEPGQIILEAYNYGTGEAITWAKLAVGTTQEIKNLQFTFSREMQFSGFQVSRDPANSLIWAGSFLLLLGLIMIFYFPYHQAWAMVQIQENGAKLSIRSASSRGLVMNSEFQNLTVALEKDLTPDNQNKEQK